LIVITDPPVASCYLITVVPFVVGFDLFVVVAVTVVTFVDLFTLPVVGCCCTFVCCCCTFAYVWFTFVRVAVVVLLHLFGLVVTFAFIF